MHSRLTILLVVDLVDYSRIMESDATTAVGLVRALKAELLEPVILGHGGEVLKRMGDGWILAFASVDPAVRAAMAVQEGLAGHAQIRLRIGAHMGEIIEDEDDFYGPGVNLAQRIQTEAPPGGLMVSQDLFRQISGNLAERFRDAGSFKLKNIAQPVTLYQWRPLAKTARDADDVPSIAVQPFSFAPSDGETEAVAADLRDQLIIHLSRRTGIRVLDDLTGRVDRSVYELRGRIRLSGVRGRMQLSLVLRETGQPAWSQIYDGDTSDIFTFCDTLIQQADADLRIQINAFDDHRIAHLPDEDLSVSELRSRSASKFYELTIESWEYSRALLERALRLNPDDPMAMAMHGEALTIASAARYETLPAATVREIEGRMNRAIEAAPRSDYIFFARACFRVYVARDAEGAFSDATRSIALSPNYAPGYEMLGLAEMLRGNFRAAAEQLARAVELSRQDPLITDRMFSHAVALILSDQSEAAIGAISEAIELKPNVPGFYVVKALAQRRAGQNQAAEATDVQRQRVIDSRSVLAACPPLPEAEQWLIEELRQALPK